jgi:predicted site-specific integrase-resolvase
MPVKINGLEYYRTNEACTMAGIAKNTFLRWVANDSYADVSHRDRRGWRLFTKEDIERLSREVNKVRIESTQPKK